MKWFCVLKLSIQEGGHKLSNELIYKTAKELLELFERSQESMENDFYSFAHRRSYLIPCSLCHRQYRAVLPMDDRWTHDINP